VAAAEGMSTGEGDDFLVVESVELKKVRWLSKARANRQVIPHTVENLARTALVRFVAGNEKDGTYGAEVVLSLGRIRETTVWGCVLGKAIDTTWAPRDLGATHFLPRDELPQLPRKCEITDRPGRQRHHRESRGRRSLSNQTPSLSPP
jgi:hypothetical protein